MLNMIFDLVSGAVKSALGSIWLYLCVILAAVSLVLAVYTARLAEKLEIANEEAARFTRIANENAAALNAVKRDFNASLNGCYEDYKTLAGKFDNYRAIVAAEKRITPVGENRGAEPNSDFRGVQGGNAPLIKCRSIPNTPLIKALNEASK
jgi:hypothetical protein